MQTKASCLSQPSQSLVYFPGLSFTICKRGEVSSRLYLGPSPHQARPRLRGTQPRGSVEVHAREGHPPGISAGGTGGPGAAHTCVRSPSPPGARSSTRPQGRGAQVQQARGSRSWGAQRDGVGRAHLSIVEQPQLVQPLRGGHGPARLRPCCAPPAAAASSAPPAGCPRPGPWAEGVTPGRSGAVLLGEVVLAPAAPSHLSLHAPPPRGRPPPGFLHLAAATAAPPLPGPCKGRGARREEELEVRAAPEGAPQPSSQPQPQPSPNSALKRANLSLPDEGWGQVFQTRP